MKFTDEPNAAEKMKEECCPGQPYISFFEKDGIMINFIYPEPMKAFYAKTIKVCSGDTVTTVRSMIAKDYQSLGM